MKSLRLIYFSPTGTTQKITREIAASLGLPLESENNISDVHAKTMSKPSHDCLSIIGLPVYAGRLPITALEQVQKLRSNGSPVVIVVVYGNRDYDDALLELKNTVSKNGFQVIAGAAFIGEHSYSSDEKPIAKNRPDKKDLEKCSDFARAIRAKLETLKHNSSGSDLLIPGHYPYKERKEFPSDIHPETDGDRCSRCGICVDVCPTNAISMQDTLITNGELCILCCACVKQCEDDARMFDNPEIEAIREKLFLNCSQRKEPIYFT